MKFNITELKNTLGAGLRKNRYMLEIPLSNGESLNILCQSASLPQRTINTLDVWHKGRKYTMRGETDYGSEYEITIIDNNKMAFRQAFDAWLQKIDDSNKGNASGASFEKSDINYDDFPLEIDINIWQLDNGGDDNGADDQKIYGYKLQNAFPKTIGNVTMDDTDQNTLVEFNVTFAYSEFIPLYQKPNGVIG